jgi:hypothetical protein
MRVVVAIMLALSCACSTASSSGPTGQQGNAGAACATPDDCTGTLCAFPVDAGCNARGRCVVEDVACMGNGRVVCACDGTLVELSCVYGAGNGPAPVPFPTPTSTSSCLPPVVDAAADAGDDSG